MMNIPITPEERFATIVGELLNNPGVTSPADKSQSRKGFGSSELKVHNKIFAMLEGISATYQQTVAFLYMLTSRWVLFALRSPYASLHRYPVLYQ